MACPLVFSCDGGYAMQLATTLRSIVESNPGAWPVDCHVLASGFSAEARARVSESLPPGSASLRWVPVDLEPFRRYATMEHISPMTYARFLIPTIFAEGISRVLYLDADLLVLGTLDGLRDAELGDAPVGAVLDGMEPRRKAGAPGTERVPRVEAYFNAGVLLIDLDRWRSERISERSLAYLAAHPDTPYSDQDALNVACDGAWRRLDGRWNVQNHDETRFSAIPLAERPGIVHFVTSAKPWKPSSLSLNAALYDSFRDRTRFARSGRERALDLAEDLRHRSRRLVRGLRYRLRLALGLDGVAPRGSG